MSIIAPETHNLTHTLCFLFSGKAGTGKTYWSDKLQLYLNNKGLKTYKAPFAFGVKSTATYMGWDGKKDQRGRRLLQRIGQDGREYDQDVWVRSTFNRIEDSVGWPYDAILIDDWRFINEYEYVNKDWLYKPIRIRIEALNREILKGTPEYYEISETELDNFSFDCVINNFKLGKESGIIVDEDFILENILYTGTTLPLTGQ
jgi:hypothetical protein